MATHRASLPCFFVLIAGVLLVAGLAAATPAWAWGHGRFGREVVVARYPALRAPFVAPRWIGPGYAAAYQPYFAGRYFYGPHRLLHTVYRFPVATAAGVVYRPFAYCGGRLVVGARLPAGFVFGARW